MTSLIDPTKPTGPIAYTADVRGNFATAKAEIEGLQGLADGAPFLPLSGGTVTGATTHNAALNVTTTGASRSWAINDRLGEVVDVQDYGLIGTGNAATDTATMLAAVAALPANGGVLKIGSANTAQAGITLNQTITITKSCRVEGMSANGWASSIVCLMSGPGILFSDPAPTYQKTFEVANVRFVANGAGPTQSAIQVSVGPTTSQVFPSFIGRNITISNNVANVAAPYAQTFTRGIEFVPATTGGAGIHNFWNVALEHVFILGSNDSATSRPIAGTAGVTFGRLVCANFNFVHVSLMASGFRQTDYCEGIVCNAVQLFTCTNGWDQAAFAPQGASNVKLLEPVLLGSMINATQSAINLDCVYAGQFQDNYLTGSGAANVLLSNVQATQLCNNFLNAGTIGISLTKGSYNEGGNLVSGNILTNIATHVSLGAGTSNDMVLDNSTGGSAAPVIVDSGAGNVIRGARGPLTVSNGGLTVANNLPLNLLDASGLPVYFLVGSDNHVALYSPNGSGGYVQICDFYAHTLTPTVSWHTPAAFGGSVQMYGTVGFQGTAPIAKPTVSGSRGGNAALASLLTALANYGLVTDSTSA